MYSRITGDYNPLHVDAEFAAATLGASQFGQLSCQRRTLTAGHPLGTASLQAMRFSIPMLLLTESPSFSCCDAGR
jgi:acyl dehydratase